MLEVINLHCCDTDAAVNVLNFVGEDVTGGDVKLNIAIDNVTVVSQDLDLCDTLPEVNLMCPLKSGHHIASIETDLPNEIPSVSG